MADVLKVASRRLIDEFNKIEAAVAASRLKKTRLQQCYSPVHAKSYLPLDVVAALEAASGKPHVTRALATMAGARLTGSFSAEKMSSLGGDLIHLSEKFAELMKSYQQSLEDGVITETESATLLKQTQIMQDVLFYVETRLSAIRP